MPGFERALGRRRSTLRGLSCCWLAPSPGKGLRSGDDDVRPWPGTEDERVPVLTCSERFSRDALALFESGGLETAFSPLR